MAKSHLGKKSTTLLVITFLCSDCFAARVTLVRRMNVVVQQNVGGNACNDPNEVCSQDFRWFRCLMPSIPDGLVDGEDIRIYMRGSGWIENGDYRTFFVTQQPLDLESYGFRILSSTSTNEPVTIDGSQFFLWSEMTALDYRTLRQARDLNYWSWVSVGSGPFAGDVGDPNDGESLVDLGNTEGVSETQDIYVAVTWQDDDLAEDVTVVWEGDDVVYVERDLHDPIGFEDPNRVVDPNQWATDPNSVGLELPEGFGIDVGSPEDLPAEWSFLAIPLPDGSEYVWDVHPMILPQVTGLHWVRTTGDFGVFLDVRNAAGVVRSGVRAILLFILCVSFIRAVVVALVVA